MIYLKFPVPQNFMMFLSIIGAALGPLLTGIISPTVCQPMCTYSFSGISSLLINTCINNYNLGRVTLHVKQGTALPAFTHVSDHLYLTSDLQCSSSSSCIDVMS